MQIEKDQVTCISFTIHDGSTTCRKRLALFEKRRETKVAQLDGQVLSIAHDHVFKLDVSMYYALFMQELRSFT